MVRVFAGDRSGNVAMMWGLMGSVLVGLIGITVDFTRAQALRNQMQNAADGAALVAERSSNLTMAQRKAAARAFFDAEMGDHAEGATLHRDASWPTAATWPARACRCSSAWRASSAIGLGLPVKAVAEANASPPIEVALVLDNTGSMSADMDCCATPRPILRTICFRSTATRCAWRWCRSWRK